jgi:hypothetical protein
MSKENSTLNILLEGLEPAQTNIPSDLEFLKSKLSESIKPAMLVEDEDDKRDDDEKAKEKKDKEDEKTVAKWYKDVQNSLDKDKNPTAPSQVGVMKAMGIPDDEKGVNRGLFNKKLRKVTNKDGGVYMFNVDELAKLRAVIGVN